MAPAPLYAPAGGSAFWVEAGDGARLRAAVFPAHGRPRGSVIVSPGRTEPIEKYAEVIGELQGRGFAVLVHDWRGQGLSQGFAGVGASRDGVRYGHARGWRLFLDDLSRILEDRGAGLPRPWIGLGHSMGGGLTLLAMAEGAAPFDGAILTAPMLGVRLIGRSSALVKAVAVLMGLLGQATRPTPPAVPRPRGGNRAEEALTHDAIRRARVEALMDAHPELRLGGQTWGWLQFAFALTARLKALCGLETIAAPVTIVTAERDRVVAQAPQRAAAARLPRGRYVEVPEAFHEILIETDDRRAVFWREFDELAEEVAPFLPSP